MFCRNERRIRRKQFVITGDLIFEGILVQLNRVAPLIL